MGGLLCVRGDGLMVRCMGITRGRGRADSQILRRSSVGRSGKQVNEAITFDFPFEKSLLKLQKETLK